MIVRVYVSALESRDIHVYRLDDDLGVLEPAGVVAVGGLAGPLAVDRARRLLHVAVREQPWRLVTFAIPHGPAEPTAVATVGLPSNVCYLHIDGTGRYLLQASYQGDQVTVSPIGPDGLVQEPPCHRVATPPHPHAVVTDPANRFVVVPSLGGDRTLLYELDTVTGGLAPTPAATVSSPPGSGPRHVRFHPSGRFVYLLHERDATLAVYAYDAVPGRLILLQRTDTLAAPAAERIWAADLGITPDGRFLYTTERGTGLISIFAVDRRTGTVTPAGHRATEPQPRGIAIHPWGRWLLSTGERSATLRVFGIDGDTGALTPVHAAPTGARAHWIEIVDLP